MKYQYEYIVTSATSAIERLKELNDMGQEGWHVMGQEHELDTNGKIVSISFLMERQVD